MMNNQSQSPYEQHNPSQGVSAAAATSAGTLKPIGKFPRKQSIHYVRSRDELLEEQTSHFENLRKKIVKTRRTKIVGTISAMYCTYEYLREMVQAGLNAFTVNMAYCTPDLLTSLRHHRDALEKEFSMQLPITCVLKGTLVRIGALTQPEIFLRKGQEYRIVLNNKVLGNNLFCAVDDKEIIKRIKIGSQILVDYGQISMTVKRIEKSDESIQHLKDEHGYEEEEFLETHSHKKRKLHQSVAALNINNSTSDIDANLGIVSGSYATGGTATSNDGSSSAASSTLVVLPEDQIGIINQSPNHQKRQPLVNLRNSNVGQDEKLDSMRLIPKGAGAPTTTSNRFADKLRKDKLGKKKIYDVIVCEVDSDCLLKAFKPIFIYQKDHYLKKENLKKYNGRAAFGDDKTFVDSIGEQVSEDDDEQDDFEDEQVVTPKDITDIHTCLDNDIDCICISNVRSARDLKTVKNIIGDNTGVRLMARIQTPEALDNFEEIVKASDGVQIARGYLTVHMPVEKMFAKQKEMIHKCHEHLKPVFISCNILDSMVSSLLPTMCEVGEISSLVSEYVDDIILSSETSCGLHPIEAIKTLSRICVEAEALRIMKRLQNPTQSNSVTIKSSKNSIPSCIINCALEAAYSIHASIIIVFTSRGYSALKLSKLRPPCPIIAVTNHKKLARNLSQISAINCMVFDSLAGTEELIQKVIAKKLENGLIKQGDLVVITSGDIEDKANQTNNLKIISVK